MAEDEMHPDVRERAVMAQPRTEVYILMDDDMRRGVAPCVVGQGAIDRLEGRSPEVFLTSETLAGVAEAAGLDPVAVERSVAEYNAGVASGTDRFGRTAMPKALDKAPYHLIPTAGTVILTSGGVAIDEQCRVRRAGGGVFANLYAAGEVMGSGQVMGDCFAGGQGVGAALTFGLRAGTIAAGVPVPVARRQ
jgi:fumarate reductase flavoprotein subunit